MFGSAERIANTEPIPADRPLTAQEAALVRWPQEHGNSDASGFLQQLADARAVSPLSVRMRQHRLRHRRGYPVGWIRDARPGSIYAADGAQCRVFIFVRRGGVRQIFREAQVGGKSWASQ